MQKTRMKTKIALPILFLWLFFLAVNGYAAPQSAIQYAPIVNLDNQQVAGLAELTRTNRGVSVRLRGVNFIAPHNAYTGWIDINNIAGDDSQRILLRIAGDVSGDGNELTLTGNLSADLVPQANGTSVLFNNGNGVFNDPMRAKIDFFVRNHGEIIPEQLVKQVTEFEGGCEVNDCATFLFVSFDAP